jgi:hypothetical protein
MLRIPHYLDNRLTDGGKVVSPTHRPHFAPQKHYYFSVSSTHFCQRLSEPQGLVRPKGFQYVPYRHLWADCLDNVGSLTSHNPIGLYGLLQDSFTFYFFYSKYVLSIPWLFSVWSQRLISPPTVHVSEFRGGDTVFLFLPPSPLPPLFLCPSAADRSWWQERYRTGDAV